MTTHAAAMGAEGQDHCPLMPTYGPPSTMFVDGSGSWLTDRDGKRYLDFLSGLAVTSLGHAHPAVTEAISRQASRLLHTSNLFATEHAAPVARTLDRLIGGGGQVFFANSGAEANECAIKLARKFGGRQRYSVVSLLSSFHGRTLATLHATGQPQKHEAFQPLPEGFRHVLANDLAEVDRAVDGGVAAVLVEVVQGEGGVRPLEADYLRGVAEICRERGALFMVDEVQTGLGRTGEWFAFQHAGLSPDVVTMAKALGNGVPIGACWAKWEVAQVFQPGDHATTFGGNPLVTAVAAAVLETMETQALPAAAAAASDRLRAGLEGLGEVAEVRGLGLLLAVELTSMPAAEAAAAAFAAGLVVNAVSPTALRLAPPLNVSDDEIDHAISILARVFAASAVGSQTAGQE